MRDRDIVHGRRNSLFSRNRLQKSVDALGELVRIKIARRSEILHESRYVLRRWIDILGMCILEKFLDATADMIEKSLLCLDMHKITPAVVPS